MAASEVYLKGLSGDEVGAHNTPTKALFASVVDGSRNLISFWSHVRSEYSQKLFTIPTDRMAAFSGVARMMHKVLQSPPEDYVAGLWRPHLLLELLWKADLHGRGLPIVAETYIGPTWSWMSLNGSFWIPATSPDEYLPHASIVEATTSPVEDPFGPIRNAKLTLRCVLSTVTLSERSDRSSRAFKTQESFSDYDRGATTINGQSARARCGLNEDYKANVDEDFRTYFFAPIASDSKAVNGLILEKSSQAPGQYVRTGVLRIPFGGKGYEFDEDFRVDEKNRDGILGLLRLRSVTEASDGSHNQYDDLQNIDII